MMSLDAGHQLPDQPLVAGLAVVDVRINVFPGQSLNIHTGYHSRVAFQSRIEQAGIVTSDHAVQSAVRRKATVIT